MILIIYIYNINTEFIHQYIYMGNIMLLYIHIYIWLLVWNMFYFSITYGIMLPID